MNDTRPATATADAKPRALRRPKATYAIRLTEEARAKLTRAATVSRRTISGELERLVHLVLPGWPADASKLSPESQREIAQVMAVDSAPLLRAFEYENRRSARFGGKLVELYSKLEATSDFARRERLRAQIDALVAEWARESRRKVAEIDMEEFEPARKPSRAK